jgi:hypothetical protein
MYAYNKKPSRAFFEGCYGYWTSGYDGGDYEE